MWNYEKRLQYPVNIKNPDGRIAQIIMSQYGGPECSNLEYGKPARYAGLREIEVEDELLVFLIIHNVFDNRAD